MKKVKKNSILSFLFSRLAVFSVLILIQFLVLVFIILKLSASGAKVLITFQLISLCVVVWIVSKDDNPSYKLAWVIAILTLPILGGVFYIMWGNKHMPLPLRNKIERFYKKVVAQMPVQTYKSDYVFEKVKEMDKPLSTRINYINKISGYPVWENTSSEYFPLGEDKFKKLLAELKNAQRFIFMEYFIIQEGQMWNPILEVLKEKAKN
ncbi:MAG: PLDc N-terminal domain-containing protein, partial [Oscillospiraceae bacterium]